MIFCSFQPYDWKTAQKDIGTDFEVYENELGFKPMYCCFAEKIKQAYMQSINIQPTTPEKLIFFKTNNFFFVKKTDHYSFLNKHSRILYSDKQYSVPHLFDFSGLKKYLKSKNEKTSPKDFLSFVSCEHEFLVDKKTINVIGEVDIRERIFNSELFSPKEKEYIKEGINDTVANTIHIYKEDYEKGNTHMTKERAVRDGTARALWWIYIQNVFFWEDYCKIIGVSPNETKKFDEGSVTIDLDKLVDLQNIFDDTPTEENLEVIISYLDDNIICD